jgi:hypothetical protein
VEVQNLLRRMEFIGKRKAPDSLKVVAEPSIEWLVRCAECGEGGVDIVCLQLDDGHISCRCRLDPHVFAGDSGSAAGAFIVGLALAA